MATLTIELPPQEVQTAFNLRRWDELLDDPEMLRIEGRVETDRHGNAIMSPPAGARHGSFQSEIAYLLRTLMRSGRVLVECPVSTADGVKAADVVWALPERIRELANLTCFPKAPDICVEVSSPRDRPREVQEKMALYFDAKAVEVWLCDPDGVMTFFASASSVPMARSNLCPDFPSRVTLR